MPVRTKREVFLQTLLKHPEENLPLDYWVKLANDEFSKSKHGKRPFSRRVVGALMREFGVKRLKKKSVIYYYNTLENIKNYGRVELYARQPLFE